MSVRLATTFLECLDLPLDNWNETKPAIVNNKNEMKSMINIILKIKTI